MSHRSATPPSTATRALHGGWTCRRASRPIPPRPAAFTTTAHPFFSHMVKQTLLLLGALLLFIGGLFVGNFATSTWPGAGNWFGSDTPAETAVLDKLKHQLDLTPAQVAKIAPIITAACADLRLISEQRHARFLQSVDEISTSITPFLSAGQQDRLQDLQAQLQHRPRQKRDQRIVAAF